MTATVATLRDEPRSIVLLDSTGSIGTQAIDVIRRNPGRFQRQGPHHRRGRTPNYSHGKPLNLGVENVGVAAQRLPA